MLLLVLAGPSHAQERGLLLGLRYDVPIPQPLPYYAGTADSLTQKAYRTLLITEGGGTYSIAPAADFLLVPRPEGFWRVGIKRSLYNDWVEDFVWATPEGTSPAYAGIQVFNGENCQGHRAQVILHAGPRYLALDQRSAGYCGGAAHPWFFNTLAVVPLDSTTHIGLPIDAVLGEDAREALEEAIESFVERLPEDEQEAYVDAADPANWGMIHRNGGWQIIGRVEDTEAATGPHFTDLPLDTPLPSAFEPAPSAALWRRIRAFAPNTVDAVVAPGGAWLVLVRPGRLSVHPVEAGRIGAARMTQALPPGARIVMTRWASGATLQRWIRRIERLATGS